MVVYVKYPKKVRPGRTLMGVVLPLKTRSTKNSEVFMHRLGYGLNEATAHPDHVFWKCKKIEMPSFNRHLDD